jgi:hypothetical protein
MATAIVVPAAVSLVDNNLEVTRYLGNLAPFAAVPTDCSHEQLHSLASVLNGIYGLAMSYKKEQNQSGEYLSCLNQIVQAEKLHPVLREMAIQITQEYHYRDRHPEMVIDWMAEYELIREDISHYFSAKDLALGEYSK